MKVFTTFLVLLSPFTTGKYFSAAEENLVKTFNETDKILFRRAARGRLMQSYMDSSVNPCEDFYKYSCDNWKKVNMGSALFYDNDVPTLITRRMEKLVQTLMEQLNVEQNLNAGSIDLKVRDYYHSCVTYNFSESHGSATYSNLLEEVLGSSFLKNNWKNQHFDWLDAAARMQLYGANALIEESVDKGIIHIKRGSIKFTDLELVDILKPHKKLYESLKELYIMKKYGNLSDSGANNTINLTRDLTKLLMSREYQPDNNTEVVTLESLIHNIPQINWIEYFTIVLEKPINTTIKVKIENEKYFHDLSALLNRTDHQSIANYLALHFLEHLLENLQVSQHFVNKFCAMRALEDITLATNALLIRRYGTKDTSTEIDEIAKSLINEFSYDLDNFKWFDDSSKLKILTKIRSTTFEIAYPNYLASPERLNKIYQNLSIDPKNYHQNFLNCLYFKEKFMHNKLTNHDEDINLNLNIMEVKMKYDKASNKMIVPAGLLVPPLYHHHLPTSYKYGTIGTMIGHQLIKQFIELTSIVDSQEGIKCFISQYDKYSIQSIGEHINGQHTLMENIADNMGVKIAFNAYFREYKGFESDRLPGLNATNTQLFFLSYAQRYCGDFSAAYYITTLNLKEHSTSKYRVLGSLTNFDEFAKQFQCPVGSTMNPERKCQI